MRQARRARTLCLPLLFFALLLPPSMRWTSSNLQSLPPAPRAPASTGWVRHPQLETVRAAMLGCLAGLTGGEAVRMGLRVRYASDIEALWYLRSDLMVLLQTQYDATTAQHMLQRVTRLFDGLLPQRVRAMPPRER